MKQCLKCYECFSHNEWECPRCNWEPEYINGFLNFIIGNSEKKPEYPYDIHKELFLKEPSSFWFRIRNKIIQSILKKYFPAANKFFEPGCGTGYVMLGFASLHPDFEYFGADIFSSALTMAQERVPQANLFLADINHIPFKDEFDVVGAFDILEHIDDDAGALKEIFKTIQPGGGIIVTVPQHPCLWSINDDFGFHRRRYTRRQLIEIIETASFQILYITSFFTVLLPAMVLVKFLSKRISKEQNRLVFLKELSLPYWIDKFFEKLCLIEHFVINNKISLPMGSSLLCVAKKK